MGVGLIPDFVELQAAPVWECVSKCECVRLVCIRVSQLRDGMSSNNATFLTENKR